jgi:quercetin dioxygenase-like cupin family protein
MTATGRETMFIDFDELKKRAIAEGVTIRTAWGERVMMSMVEMAPNSVVPRHTHPHEQMGMVLDGEFELTVGEESRLLKAGDGYLVPSGVEHSVKVLAAPTRAMDIFSPPRQDYM